MATPGINTFFRSDFYKICCLFYVTTVCYNALPETARKWRRRLSYGRGTSQRWSI